jgi:hypothetical protein
MIHVSHPMQEKAMAIKASTHGRQCEKNPNHWLDPTWDTCPYCEAEKRAKQRTHTDQSSAVSGSQRNPTLVSGSSHENTRRGTKVMPDQGSPKGNGPPPARGKRIVAVLVTYNRRDRPEGSLFHIHEGRNYIGAGNIASETSERPCDILIEEDKEMSGEHSLILYQQGTFQIVDKETTNGTFVNGNLIPTLQGYRLENYAKITTGKTIWTFIIIAPSGKVPDEPTPPDDDIDEHIEPPSGKDTHLF